MIFIANYVLHSRNICNIFKNKPKSYNIKFKNLTVNRSTKLIIKAVDLDSFLFLFMFHFFYFELFDLF